MKKKDTVLSIDGIQFYITTDSDGYVSLSTDGWKKKSFDKIITMLRQMQTDDDREADLLFNAAQHNIKTHGI